jgi:nitrogen fixation/metabolism regulation signal transduction histidine kinase
MDIKKRFIDLYEGIIGSLDNKKNKGFSARKISVLVVMVCIIFVHASWLKHAFLREDYEYIIEILTIDSLFVLLLLGIVTMEQITKFKNGSKPKEENE